MPDVNVNGNNDTAITNVGGHVLIGGSNHATINNKGGYVIITGSNVRSEIKNMGGDIVISRAADISYLTNNSNITIGYNAIFAEINIANGVLAIGDTVTSAFINLHRNSVFVLPDSSDLNAFITISGTADLVVQQSATNNRSYNAQISGFDYSRDSILLPQATGPYTATYIGTVLTLVGQVTYTFNNIAITNFPTTTIRARSVISTPRTVKYSYITPAVARTATFDNVPTSSTVTYNTYYYGAAPIVPAVPCFVSGTNILTPTGYVKIENLKVGSDISVWLNNKYITKPIEWIGKFRQETIGINKFYTSPVRIKRAAISDNVPQTDLLVSPIHSLLFDTTLIQAIQLVNNQTIYQDTTFNDVTYYHIKLGAHHIINADGVLTESYFDMFSADRDNFENGTDITTNPLAVKCDTSDAQTIREKCAAATFALDDQSKIEPYRFQLNARAKKLNNK